MEVQQALQRAPNTLSAYRHGLNDYLGFCIRNGIDYERAGRVEVAAFIRDMAERPATGRRSAKGLANATVRLRLTVVRLFYDYLIEEGVRSHNPAAYGTSGQIGVLVRGQRRLPWIPTDEDWLTVLDAAREEPLRNRLMLALAYDCALRRGELCAVATGDFDPAYHTITIRAETTKTGCGRCLPYSPETSDLFANYLAERRSLGTVRGPLFLSTSTRNRGAPLSLWTWSKVVQGLALRSGVSKLSTHSFRHLCLTDLARTGWEAHEIATFAGHRNIQTTLIYIHLSARDLSAKFLRGMASLHQARMALLKDQLA
jgi:integrase/recombinase XerD